MFNKNWYPPEGIYQARYAMPCVIVRHHPGFINHAVFSIHTFILILIHDSYGTCTCHVCIHVPVYGWPSADVKRRYLPPEGAEELCS